MAEEEIAEQAPVEEASDFDRTFGGTPDESQASEPEAQVGDTPDFDYESINIETVDINTLPEKDRPLAARLQARAKEMSNGIRQKLSEENTYTQQIEELKSQIEQLQRPPEPAQPATPDSIGQAMGFDLSQATEQQRRSFSVVTEIVEKHPVVQQLREELANIREQAEKASGFVQEQEDKSYEQSYAEAVQAHGQENVDNLLDYAGNLLGQPAPGGGTFNLTSAIGLMLGKTVAESQQVNSQAAEATKQAKQSASGVTVTSGLSDNGPDLSDAEYDRLWAEIERKGR